MFKNNYNMKKIIFSIVVALISIYSATAQVHMVEVTDFVFKPNSISIQQGDTVQWINRTRNPHTSTSGNPCEADGKWNSGPLKANETFTYVFKEAGKFNYFCIPHCEMGMTGEVIVTEKRKGKSDK